MIAALVVPKYGSNFPSLNDSYTHHSRTHRDKGDNDW